MKKADVFAGGAVAVLALIGAGEIVRRIVQGFAWALTTWGGWDAADAAKAAPVACAAIAAGLAMSLYGMYKDNQRYSRQRYGKVDCTAYREQRQNRRGA